MKKERGVPVNREAMDEYQFSSNPEREREREQKGFKGWRESELGAEGGLWLAFALSLS